LSPDSSFWNEL